MLFQNHFLPEIHTMLRFRPIAPKPASVESAPHTAGLQRRNGVVEANGKRMKRKYVRVCRRRRQNQSKTKENVAKTTSSGENSAVDDHSSPEKRVLATLQLLPHVDCDKKHCDSRNITALHKNDEGVTVNVETASFGAARSVVKESWIIVECVTEMMTAFEKLGFSSSVKDKIGRLEDDTCPGFVTDSGNNVIWVNGAYRRMLGSINVWLVVKQKLPQFCPSFACRVTLIQQTERGQKWNRIAHCDVWKITEEFAGFAWRLDLNTSIGLGF